MVHKFFEWENWGDGYPEWLEHTPKFFRGQQVGDSNNVRVCVFKKIEIRIHKKHEWWNRTSLLHEYQL